MGHKKCWYVLSSHVIEPENSNCTNITLNLERLAQYMEYLHIIWTRRYTCSSRLWFSHRSCRNLRIGLIIATFGVSFLSSFSLVCLSTASSWPATWPLWRSSGSSDCLFCLVLNFIPPTESSSYSCLLPVSHIKRFS